MSEYPWKHNRRFNAYANYFRNNFGERIQKLTIDAGFTCPNRDGTLSYGGCTFCNNNAFNPSYCNPKKSIDQQISEGIEFHKNRYRRANKYLVYFQAYSNTYALINTLKKIYNEALNCQNILGVVIGTRPDCIDDEKLDYFQELSKSKYVILEYGVETTNNKILKKINRCHTYEQSVEAIEKTAERGIKTGAHFIFGLPGETNKDNLLSVKTISKLPLNTIKIHQLQIIRNTKMAEIYKNNPEYFTQFKLDEYIDLIVDFVERLNPNFMIERIAGEVPPRFLAGHGWGLIRNDQILQKFEKRLEERKTYQGRIYCE